MRRASEPRTQMGEHAPSDTTPVDRRSSWLPRRLRSTSEARKIDALKDELDKCVEGKIGQGLFAETKLSLLEELHLVRISKLEKGLSLEEQGTLHRTSPPGTFPAVFTTPARRLSDFSAFLNRYGAGTGAKTVTLTVLREKDRAREVNASVDAAASGGAGVEASAQSSSKEHENGGTTLAFGPDYYVDELLLTNPFVEDFNLMDATTNAINRMREYEHDPTKTFQKSSVDLNRSIGTQRARSNSASLKSALFAAGAGGAKDSASIYDFQLKIEYYGSEDLVRLSKEHREKGMAPKFHPEWVNVANKFIRILEVYARREQAVKAQHYLSAIWGPLTRLNLPFQWYVAGERGSGKSSLFWAMEMASKGWISKPAIVVRAPIAHTAGTPNEQVFPLGSALTQDNRLCCVAVDLPGGVVKVQLSEETRKENQFVVVVIEATRLFTATRDDHDQEVFGLNPNWQDEIEEIPHYEECKAVFLTKWDLLFSRDEPKTMDEMLRRLDHVWNDPEKLRIITHCCEALGDAFNDEKLVMRFRTPILGEKPSDARAEAQQKEGVRLMDGMLNMTADVLSRYSDTPSWSWLS